MINSPHKTTFSNIDLAPKDPILGITESYNNDVNPNKINLGVGVYYDENGNIPLLECVKLAETFILEKCSSKVYQPIDGNKKFNFEVQKLIFGSESDLIQSNKAVTVQTLGGTGALKIGADFLKKFFPSSQVWISNPSWENHKAIFETAGFKVNCYDYYNDNTHDVNFDEMYTQLNKIPSYSIIIFHASCHNPTGADLNSSQWDQIIELIKFRHLIPFLDMAYQGFSGPVELERVLIKKFVSSLVPILISNSFSKSFSLYGERIGALSIVSQNSNESNKILSQLKRLIRTNYSSPPTHGGQIITLCLSETELRKIWEEELSNMRTRIIDIRESLVKKLKIHSPNQNFNFIINQKGMFSYSGLKKENVEILRRNYSIYIIETGRICVAAINNKNLDYISKAISKAL